MLNAAHGDNDRGICLNQNGGVDDPVLFGPHQFFTVQDEDHFRGFVYDPQFRYGAITVLFNDLDQVFAQASSNIRYSKPTLYVESNG